MKLACWNVRGFNGPLTQNIVASLCRQHNIAIFGILETKVAKDRIGGIMYRKFRGWNFHSNHGEVQGGRIVITWNAQMVDCVPVETHAQVIHCRVRNKITSQKFLCSFVYGASTPAAREDLWSNLISCGVNHAEPWLLLGDYNCVLSLDERQGGQNPHAHDMEKFISYTTTLGLEDAPSIGNFFTWSNGNFWSKIDRVLLNSDWHSSNLRCMADFLEFNTLSDHSIIMVTFLFQFQLKPRPFRFLSGFITCG